MDETDVPMIELRAGSIVQSYTFTPEGIAQMARVCGDPSFWEYLKSVAPRPKPNRQDEVQA